ncbi:MAG: AAA domain-containing protein, partial [Candidatus Methylomirabilales bacterium]
MSKANSTTHNKTGDQPVREQAIRLFMFLRELTELRTKTIRTSDQYEKVLWFNDFPREPGCHCIAWSPVEEYEVWLEIKKPRLKAPPERSEALKPWLDPREVEDSSREFPVLRERITVNVPGEADKDGRVEPRTVFKELEESPEIKSLWEYYVEEKWQPWAEEDRRLQAVQKVYTDLFSIYQKQQRLGELYEVVLGLGYLTWRTPSGNEVKRHIISAQTSIIFDAVRGVIRVGLAGEGAKPTLEQDMLEPQERPDPAEQNAIEKQIEEIGDALWDGTRIQAVLNGWIHATSRRGEFGETLIPQTVVGPDPKIHLAPAVILRKRTERNLLRVFQEIIQQLRGGESVPLGVRRLTTIIDDATPPADEGKERDLERKGPLPLEEIYFPLPANDEQLEIARRLAVRQGVLVQGPPGTGKSHTIANLVCHLLATDQRVLITSHTSRALKVLLDKFKKDIDLKEIADLCVILLGDDLTAMQALEDSVRGITDRYNTWDAQRNRRHIAELENNLDKARRAEASKLTELRAIREAETYRHSLRFGSYEGTGQAIASRLRTQEPRYSWMT